MKCSVSHCLWRNRASVFKSRASEPRYAGEARRSNRLLSQRFDRRVVCWHHAPRVRVSITSHFRREQVHHEQTAEPLCRMMATNAVAVREDGSQWKTCGQRPVLWLRTRRWESKGLLPAYFLQSPPLGRCKCDASTEATSQECEISTRVTLVETCGVRVRQRSGLEFPNAPVVWDQPPPTKSLFRHAPICPFGNWLSLFDPIKLNRL